MPQSLAAILSERKDRSKLGLSQYVVEAAEEAAAHPDKLKISKKAKDVADVHKTLWPAENQNENILQIGVLINPPQRLVSGNNTSTESDVAT